MYSNPWKFLKFYKVNNGNIIGGDVKLCKYRKYNYSKICMIRKFLQSLHSLGVIIPTAVTYSYNATHNSYNTQQLLYIYSQQVLLTAATTQNSYNTQQLLYIYSQYRYYLQQLLLTIATTHNSYYS